MPSSSQSSLWMGNILNTLSMSVFAMNVPGLKSGSTAIALHWGSHQWGETCKLGKGELLNGPATLPSATSFAREVQKL